MKADEVWMLMSLPEVGWAELESRVAFVEESKKVDDGLEESQPGLGPAQLVLPLRPSL